MSFADELKRLDFGLPGRAISAPARVFLSADDPPVLLPSNRLMCFSRVFFLC